MLINPSHPTRAEIAASFSLWGQFVDPSGLDTRERFDAMTDAAKFAFMADCFGPDTMTTTTTNTRPTDAELVKLLRHIYRNALAKNLHELVMVLGPTADALEAAGVEPSPLAHITTISHLFEMIDWDFDGNGLTVTDGDLLANAIAITFPALKNDMPHLVTNADKTGSLHRPDCSPDCSTHHWMTNEAPYNDEPYTVSGVDYTFTEGC